eukprot:m.88922 g.88922  ORF g.88922 m.88922 type:complete len:88 (-) comp12279_c0_seq9:1118-1381(-)
MGYEHIVVYIMSVIIAWVKMESIHDLGLTWCRDIVDWLIHRLQCLVVLVVCLFWSSSLLSFTVSIYVLFVFERGCKVKLFLSLHSKC